MKVKWARSSCWESICLARRWSQVRFLSGPPRNFERIFMKKLKLTKYIWFENEKWKVEKILRPTKFDFYLLLSRKETGSIHEDDKTIPTTMILIDANNDTFYPDTEHVRNLLEQYNQINNDLQQRERKLRDELTHSWLKVLNFD